MLDKHKKERLIFMYYNERIKFIRESKNITQTEMAEALGIKQTVYSRYERGQNELKVEKLTQICKYLNVSADYILGLND